MRVLVVEDNFALANRLKGLLSEAGFVVDHAEDGEKGCLLGETTDYDAILLDLDLPKLPGLDVLKTWRNGGRQVPVMIVTCSSGWQERVLGFNAGADDYLEKPFENEELLARLRSLLRRANGKNSPVLVHKSISLNTTSGEVTCSGEPVPMTALELRILNYLMNRPERIVSQGELNEHVYAGHGGRESNTIEVYIARLRKKLGARCIRTIRGLGYRMG